MGSYPISLRRQGNYYLAGSKSAYSPRFLNFDYPFVSFEPAAFRDCEANRGFMIRARSERKNPTAACESGFVFDGGGTGIRTLAPG